MNDYLCLTLLSRGGEAEPEFKRRLSELWSAILRAQPDDFEKVYAEAVACDRHGDRLGRRYLIESEVAAKIAAEVGRGGFDPLPLDAEDVYSKYEAAPPEWFWIEH